MDCFDRCGLIATVVDGRLTAIAGDPDHPVTRGRICTKGKQLLFRHNHPDRLRTPLLRTDGRWKKIDWPEAISLMARRLSAVIDRGGPEAVWHLGYSGYEGLGKQVDRLFFNCLGGVTAHRGDLCWRAGITAQKFDFGAVQGHHPDDMAKAKTLVIWGRNPVETNTHLVPAIRKARQAGARVWLIDPVKTPTAGLAHVHLAVAPGTDGALALAMANHMVSKGWTDDSYMARHVVGYRRFVDSIGGNTPAWAETVTGIDRRSIESLAEAYAQSKPACIVLGYGLQRYTNGGATIRCIDALGAITGNIGQSGAGVNYANRTVAPLVGGVLAESEARVSHRRTFPLPRVARFLATADPPIRAAVITRANPLAQAPDSRQMKKAFSAIGFKVVIDMFMTDTARQADLVLPTTSVFEETDVFLPSMFSPVITCSETVVAPPDGIIGEFDLFARLAAEMGVEAYPKMDRTAYFESVLDPLLSLLSISLGDLQRGYVTAPNSDIPWQNGRFGTPSGKYELYSEAAAAAGHPPLPGFQAPEAAPDRYPLRLLTPHARHSMHSQHFAFVTDLPTAHLHPDLMTRTGLADGRRATVISAQGDLTVRVKRSPRVADGLVMIYQGWWHHSGCVNQLTVDHLSDMGENAVYNETFCRLEPAG